MSYCVIDTETANVPEQEQEIERAYVPLGNTKNERLIDEKRNGLKLGVCDLSPVWCIGCKVPSGIYIFSQAVLSPAEFHFFASVGIHNLTAPSEAQMLEEFASFLACLGSARLVTANGCGFDIPHLKFRYSYHNLNQPKELYINKHTDLFKKFREFSVSNRTGFAGVEEMCKKLRIPFVKTIPGSRINDYIESGRHVELLLYNAMDLIAEELIFKRMYKGYLF